MLLDTQGIHKNYINICYGKEKYEQYSWYLSLDHQAQEKISTIIEKQKELDHQWLSFRDELICGDIRGLLDNYGFMPQGEKIVWGGYTKGSDQNWKGD